MTPVTVLIAKSAAQRREESVIFTCSPDCHPNMRRRAKNVSRPYYNSLPKQSVKNFTAIPSNIHPHKVRIRLAKIEAKVTERMIEFRLPFMVHRHGSMKELRIP